MSRGFESMRVLAQALDTRRLRVLLESYAATRPLTAAERGHFVTFMRLSLLCSCSWRFKAFHVLHRELDTCRDAHLELQAQMGGLVMRKVIG
tara:strand:- start:345 stop:620 length:276 start_codon:yes stop_codon:yes gene_type:complete